MYFTTETSTLAAALAAVLPAVLDDPTQTERAISYVHLSVRGGDSPTAMVEGTNGHWLSRASWRLRGEVNTGDLLLPVALAKAIVAADRTRTLCDCRVDTVPGPKGSCVVRFAEIDGDGKPAGTLLAHEAFQRADFPPTDRLIPKTRARAPFACFEPQYMATLASVIDKLSPRRGKRSGPIGIAIEATGGSDAPFIVRAQGTLREPIDWFALLMPIRCEPSPLCKEMLLQEENETKAREARDRMLKALQEQQAKERVATVIPIGSARAGGAS